MKTVKEVAEKYSNNKLFECNDITGSAFNSDDLTTAFLDGAKEMEKRLYTEEELLLILQYYKEKCEECVEDNTTLPEVKEWFEPKFYNKRLNPNL